MSLNEKTTHYNERQDISENKVDLAMSVCLFVGDITQKLVVVTMVLVNMDRLSKNGHNRVPN